MPIQKTLVFAASLLAFAQPWAQPQPAVGASAASRAAPSRAPAVLTPNATAVRQQRLSFASMGLQRPLLLRGVDGETAVNMGVRLDEVVESARLRLMFTLSPALLPGLSHLKVMLNDEVVQTIAVDKAQQGAPQVADVVLPARHFGDFNRLRIQLIGHYTLDCESPQHSSLWASISPESHLDLSLRALPIPNDLALLPAPFFDVRDNRPAPLSFVYGAAPSDGVLQAAGIVAAWMGVLAAYRGTRFDAVENALPTQHAVVLANNAQRPDFIKDLPPVQQPTLRLMAHPHLPGVKLLLVLGQDDAQVQQAAQVLVSGRAALSGQAMAVTALEPAPRRKAYDAPRWLSSQRPVQLGELVGDTRALQVRGSGLDATVRIPTQMAPDLFTWNTSGVPMKLQYRHTPVKAADRGTLELAINDRFIKSYPLGGAEETTSGWANVVLPLFDDGGMQAKWGGHIPAFFVGNENQLQLTFQVPPADIGRCRTVQPPQLHAAIDPTSSIDLSGFHHYVAMPNVGIFASSGFPFTKYADLAETSVVLPNVPTPADVGLYLSAVARMGAHTGHAGTRFALLRAANWQQARGTDMLVVTHADRDGLLAQWQHALPALLSRGARSVQPLDRALNGISDFFRMDSPHHLPAPAGRAVLEGSGPLAAVLGLRSPLDSDRTVVVLTATDEAALAMVSEALADGGKRDAMRGDLSLLRAGAVESFRINPVYYVGDLPWWRRLWLAVHGHPFALAGVGVVCVLLLSLMLYVGLRRRARSRLQSIA